MRVKFTTVGQLPRVSIRSIGLAACAMYVTDEYSTERHTTELVSHYWGQVM